MLVTPVERVGITVDDAPFLAVEMAVDGRRATAATSPSAPTSTTSSGSAPTPLRFERDAHDGVKPYVHVRGGLWARLTRALALDLVDLGEERDVEGAADLRRSPRRASFFRSRRPEAALTRPASRRDAADFLAPARAAAARREPPDLDDALVAIRAATIPSTRCPIAAAAPEAGGGAGAGRPARAGADAALHRAGREPARSIRARSPFRAAGSTPTDAIGARRGLREAEEEIGLVAPLRHARSATSTPTCRARITSSCRWSARDRAGLHAVAQSARGRGRVRGARCAS